MLNIFRKDFLLGIGLGFLLSALIVNLSGMEKLTDSEIIERAAQLGMARRDSIEKPAGEPVEKPVESAPQAPVANAAQTPVKNDAQTPVANSAQSPADDTENITGKTGESGPADNMPIVKFEIKPGTGSEEIARKLEEQGVVADREEFYRLVTEKNAHHRFRTGAFELPSGGDMEEILEILTGR